MDLKHRHEPCPQCGEPKTYFAATCRACQRKREDRRMESRRGKKRVYQQREEAREEHARIYAQSTKRSDYLTVKEATVLLGYTEPSTIYAAIRAKDIYHAYDPVACLTVVEKDSLQRWSAKQHEFLKNVERRGVPRGS